MILLLNLVNQTMQLIDLVTQAQTEINTQLEDVASRSHLKASIQKDYSNYNPDTDISAEVFYQNGVSTKVTEKKLRIIVKAFLVSITENF